MKNKLQCLLSLLVALILVLPNYVVDAQTDVVDINLSSVENSDGTYTHSVLVNNNQVNEYDYTWHVDPSVDHDEVKNSPAEYYTGQEPGDEDIYIAHDIYYYPELDADKFVKKQYDGEYEWLYYYTAQGYEDYIFSTLPVEGNDVPTRMMHSEAEAYENAVLHINTAGTYRLSGNWHGQIYIDLGEDAFDDPSQTVTLILDNVDIDCSVASGICFKNVYEVDNTWEDRDEALTSIDTTGAGANIIIGDGSTNNVSGTNIFRILKTKYKDEDSNDEVKTQKKALKVDGSLYSYMSLNVDGENKNDGVLNINSEFEGLDSELHLTINGGNINITSDNDGINVNEDDVSIFTMNDGVLQILAGTGYEGDGIDSNGYININGGSVISSAKPQADSGLDASISTHINGGRVIATGSSMDIVSEYSEDSNQVTLNLVFSSQQDLTDSILITDSNTDPVFGFDLSSNEFYKDANRTYQCLIISDDSFNVNDEYYMYIGADIKGNNVNGIIENCKSFTNGNQLIYSSTGNVGRMGFMPGGMNGGDFEIPEGMPQMADGQAPQMPQGDFDPNNLPEGFDQNNIPEKPEGDRQMPQGDFDPNNLPEDFDPNNIPEDGKQMPENFNPNENVDSGETKTIFVVEDKVNTYSGVSISDIVATSSSTSMFSGSNLMVIGGCLLAGVLIGVLVLTIVKK